ncbi:glycoside hydrolase family 130 protein [Paenibacillus sp. FA6]|uniref:glycoside hydrolase family 130 protein n=1 Tax=Paenibacillus sp. FA6 TaxID=3413029 RepID=UPI003F6577B4
MAVIRYYQNPIIVPTDIKASTLEMEVIGVFNAGVIRYQEEIILLLRVAEKPINDNPDEYLTPVYSVETDSIKFISISKKDPDHDFSDSRVIKTPSGNYLTSISHFRVARSKDGIDFSIEEQPSVFPATMYETFGIEDARITKIGEYYYITYSGISDKGIVTALISTNNFLDFKREGVIFHPDNKDVVIFPELINGKYYAIHRPSSSHYGEPEMWIAESSDLLCWGNHRFLLGLRPGTWDSVRIGASAVPIRLKEGWLEIYHGADESNRYCIGAVLLDIDEPWKVIARSEEPIMEPQADYECEGFFGNVIFPCGALYEDNKIKIYYGASDQSIAYAEISLENIRSGLKHSLIEQVSL